MEIVPGFFMPLWGIIALIAVAAAIIIFIILKVFLNLSFLKLCDKISNDKKRLPDFIKVYSGRRLLRKSRLIEKSALKNGIDIISDTGLDKLWENQFLAHPKPGYLKKIIKHFPAKGMFFCILGGSTRRPVFEKIFTNTIEKNSDLNILKKIAAAGDGKDFEGEYAAKLAGSQLRDIIEMTGDPEWQIRFFAIKILMYIREAGAERAVWEAFEDSSAEIRKIVASEFKTDKTEELGAILKSLLINDPSYRVRRAVRLRLDKDYPELYRIELDGLTKPQIVHLLGQLHDGSSEDENTAFNFLLASDVEIRLQAALYLQRQHSLAKIFNQANDGDKIGYERIKNLLTKACEVNCTNFLQELKNTNNPAAIKLAAGILQRDGNRKYIDILAQKVFAEGFNKLTREYYTEIYKETINCISLRGSDKALNLLNNELIKHAEDKELSTIIMPLLPLRGDYIFIPSLINILKNGGCHSPELLRETIERFPPSMFIEQIITILHSPPETVSAAVRKEAFMILGELKMPCCLQVIMENLKLLSRPEQKDFAVILNSYDSQVFAERAGVLLKTKDSTVKSAIITALPSTGLKQFIKDIQDATKDADPEVRIAGIWGLAGYGEEKMISSLTEMLRDPVERVRIESASVIAKYGNSSVMNELKKILLDANEVYPVKAAAIRGLGESSRAESIKILVDSLEIPELRSCAIETLSKKTKKAEIKYLTELFKKASPQLREYIAEVFKTMGEDCEDAVTGLLKEETESLRMVLSEILFKMGYIENTVTRLRHRKPEVRKKAAAVLALIQTKDAFKGMLLAARDPDSEVRAEVLKALEKLNSPEGKEILAELKEDPDKRVRKYTLWAMERLEAEKMKQ